MSSISTSIWASVILAVLTTTYLIRKIVGFRRKQGLLPPGPPRTFFIGNAHEMENTHSWFYYTRLAKTYGDIFSVDAIGQPIISLNSYEVCDDLLNKRSAVYQGRPHPIMAGELVGWGKGTALAEGTTVQIHRKLMNQFLSPKAVVKQYSLIEEAAKSLALRLLSTKDRFVEEFQFGLASTALNMGYGIRPEGKDDKLITTADDAITIFGLASEPGKWLVDSFPILKYVPSWFPGAGFQRIARKWRIRLYTAFSQPFEVAKAQMAAGTAKSSFASQALENPPPGATEEIILWASGTLYVAAVTTTVSAMTTFALNMVLHPEIQAKAQAEIDSVIGKDRLPTLADRPNLPYLDAILKETMRIHPPAPIGVLYRATEDDHYRGYLIPKDAIVVSNFWAISRDPKMYPSPERFYPERFESPGVLDPHQYIFGFGRRFCIGRYLADANLWISMATILATFDFKKAKDPQGREITPPGEYTGGMLCGPLPFKYEITPRSKSAVSLIREANLENL